MKIAICTPCYSGQTSCAFTDSLIQTLTSAPPGFEPGWAKHIGCPYIDLARSMVTAHAMEWGADKLFFIDDDISWRPDDFWRVVRFGLEPITVGTYPMYTKQIDISKPISEQVRLCYRPLEEPVTIGPTEHIDGCGLGFACITRAVFETLKPTVRHFNRSGFSDGENAEMYDYFASIDVEDEWCGEDFGFCRRARGAGFDIVLDKTIRLIHHEGRMGLTGATQ